MGKTAVTIEVDQESVLQCITALMATITRNQFSVPVAALAFQVMLNQIGRDVGQPIVVYDNESMQ